MSVFPSAAYQMSSVCVPVTVSPLAMTGTTITKCCGTPTVTQGVATCGGIKNGQCVFTISQDICVEVPVEFGAVATVGDTYVECVEASADDVCMNCNNYIPDVPVVTDTTK